MGDGGGAETAAWIAAGVAFLVGIIGPAVGAVTAGRRQKKELAHARDLRTYDELVALLEEAAGVLTASRRANEKLHDLWKTGIDPDSELGHTEITRRTNVVPEVRLAYSKLLLRFHEDDAIPARFKEASNLSDAYRGVLGGYIAGAEYKANMAAVNEARRDLIAGEEAFLAAAREHLQPQRAPEG